MRRWVCIVALLAGFSADGYAYTVRTRLPVPIERTLDEPAGADAPERRPDLTRTAAWWAQAPWARS
ncbi:MAG TPA: hypothetical protein VFV72_10780 [Candidatus Limnocylindrales bacterium]|nr:hypothetical protein [Candidatus Limnocylindrales bacterium]